MRSNSKFVELGGSTEVTVAWIAAVGVIVTAICGLVPALIKPSTPEPVVQPSEDKLRMQKQYPELAGPSVDSQNQQLQNVMDDQILKVRKGLQQDMSNDPTIPYQK